MVMNIEAMLAKYKEASVRADETIEALNDTVKVQRQVINLLHEKIGAMEKEIAQLQEAL
jgi:uncharacterized coiled-coil protein SlyX